MNLNTLSLLATLLLFTPFSCEELLIAKILDRPVVIEIYDRDMQLLDINDVFKVSRSRFQQFTKLNFIQQIMPQVKITQDILGHPDAFVYSTFKIKVIQDVLVLFRKVHDKKSLVITENDQFMYYGKNFLKSVDYQDIHKGHEKYIESRIPFKDFEGAPLKLNFNKVTKEMIGTEIANLINPFASDNKDIFRITLRHANLMSFEKFDAIDFDNIKLKEDLTLKEALNLFNYDSHNLLVDFNKFELKFSGNSPSHDDYLRALDESPNFDLFNVNIYNEPELKITEISKKLHKRFMARIKEEISSDLFKTFLEEKDFNLQADKINGQYWGVNFKDVYSILLLNFFGKPDMNGLFSMLQFNKTQGNDWKNIKSFTLKELFFRNMNYLFQEHLKKLIPNYDIVGNQQNKNVVSIFATKIKQILRDIPFVDSALIKHPKNKEKFFFIKHKWIHKMTCEFVRLLFSFSLEVFPNINEKLNKFFDMNTKVMMKVYKHMNLFNENGLFDTEKINKALNLFTKNNIIMNEENFQSVGMAIEPIISFHNNTNGTWIIDNVKIAVDQSVRRHFITISNDYFYNANFDPNESEFLEDMDSIIKILAKDMILVNDNIYSDDSHYEDVAVKFKDPYYINDTKFEVLLEFQFESEEFKTFQKTWKPNFTKIETILEGKENPDKDNSEFLTIVAKKRFCVLTITEGIKNNTDYFDFTERRESNSIMLLKMLVTRFLIETSTLKKFEMYKKHLIEFLPEDITEYTNKQLYMQMINHNILIKYNTDFNNDVKEYLLYTQKYED